MCPKLESLLDCIEETEARMITVTETWLSDGPKIDQMVVDLAAGSGIRMLYKNRQAASVNGVTHGGVAFLWRETFGAFREVDIRNPESYEVLVTAGSVRGYTRKFVVFSCYVPPNYSAQKGRAVLDFIADNIVEIKRRFTDPFIIVTGYFNQWAIDECLQDFADLGEVVVGNTRKDKCIDHLFANMTRSVKEAGTIAPLESADGTCKSDHRVVYCTLDVPRRETFKWETFKYRHYNPDAANAFRAWIVLHDWKEVYNAQGSNGKANAYQDTMGWALDEFFPYKTTRKKSNELPWMNKTLRKAIEGRKRLFWTEGGKRMEVWKEERDRVNEMIVQRKRGYMDVQKDHLLAKDTNRNFFRHVKNFCRHEKPELFDVKSLLPGMSDSEVADHLAEYFIKVSREFDPLEPSDIPTTTTFELPFLACHEVSARLRKFRKPKSKVQGDIFPNLVTALSDFLAIPLTEIYNEIITTKVWPLCWKVEYVTVILKKSSPESLADLRNISCTLLVSKVFESYVLDWLKSEVQLRNNQYGGVRGLSTDTVLVQLWQEVLENLEDYRAATVITSVDYSKAFNRMSYQHCLRTLAKKGASTSVLALVATFLTNRKMRVKMGQSLSEPLSVTGGCPKGSILGVFLFNSTIDDLEEGCCDISTEENGVTVPTPD